MDAVAPALLVAQAIGRIGNYFNKELFGGPTSLPWGMEVPLAFRPPGYARYPTFHPTFLYELIFDLALAALLVWLGHHRAVKPPGLFALYVTGYSAFRIFEEALRVDPSEHFLGLRLNMYVATVLTVAGVVWFWRSQRRGQAQTEAAATGDGDGDVQSVPDRDGAAGAGPAKADDGAPDATGATGPARASAADGTLHGG
jgi:prolipoprotein diacylglyceryl transferase